MFDGQRTCCVIQKPALEDTSLREADAHDKQDIDRLADMGMSRVQHDVDEDSGGSDDDELGRVCCC